MSVTFQTTTLATPPSGTVVDTGSGAAGAGTQRTILATDQQAVPVKLQDGAGNALTSAARGSERAASVQIVDASGAQITTFGGSGGTASNVGSAVPSSATAAGFSDATNLQLARVYDTDSGGGTQYTVGVSLRKTASGGSVEAGTSTDPLRCDPTGTTTQPVSGTVAATQSGAWALTANQSVNVAQINGVTPLMGNGASGTGASRVTIANDSTGILAGVTTVSTVTNVATIGTSVTPGTAAANLGKAEDAVHTSGDVGVMALAVRNDSVAALAGTTGDYIPLTTDSTGRVWASAKIDTALPAGTAALGTVTLDDAGTGWSVSAANSANSTNATSAKGSAGRLHGYAVYNSNASPRYLKIYNKASAPTVGTDTPFWRVLIPAGGGANVSFPSPGITLGTGIAWALTTGAADSDTGAVASNEIQVNITYS